MKSTILMLGGVFILLAIIFGAFGAHALQNHLTIKELDSFQTGIQYQLYHGLALLVLGFNFDKVNKARLICWGIVTGTILFSGSIYLLSLDSLLGIKLSFLWPVTPIGGSILIVSWIMFVYALRKKIKH